MIYLAGTDFSHLTNDELIKGIQALNLPDYIRSKAYGVDVRETLAQMTEMTIQLGVNMGLSPDEALKWARKLQESVSQSEFDSWVATLLDGGPSIFMNTLNELKAAYPNGASGVALVRETDPAKIYVWNGSAWEDFGNYQGIEIKDGTVTSDKLAQNAVTASKTDFLNPEQITNLWNVDRLASGQINRLDGTILTNDNFSYTDYYINTTGQTVATVSYPTTATPYVITYAFYTDMDPSTYISGENLPSNLTIQIPSTANYMRMSARHDTNDITKLQVNFGSTALPLETPTYAADERIKVGTDNIKDNTITSDKLVSVDADKLSIIDFLDNQPTEDYQYIPYGNYRISANYGKIWTAKGSVSGSELTTQYTATGRIPVVGGQTYRAKARNYIVFDSDNKVIQFIENSALVYREITIAENGATMALSPLVVEATSQFGLTRITPLVSEKLFTIPNLQNSQSRFNGKNVALFGDSITGNNPQISDTIANRLGLNTLNMAIGGAKMAERNDTAQTAGGGHTANSGVRIAEAIISGDFSTQREYTNAQYSGGTLTRIMDTLELLENTNFSEVDYATVQFGANDYLQGVPIGSIAGDRYTYMGAYRIFIETLLEAYPNIKILIVSTPMIFDAPPKGIEMSDYVQATKEVAAHFNLPYLDNFTNAGINNYNRYEFFGPTDGVHPNNTGLAHLGNRIASAIEANY